MQPYAEALLGVLLLAVAAALPYLGNVVMLWDAPWLNKPTVSRTKVKAR